MNKPKDNGRIIWCWADHADAEYWNGPFESREDAISEAIADSDADEIFVRTGIFHDAGKYADINDIHDRINELCADDDVWTDEFVNDPFFLVPNEEEAQAELKEFCRKWFAPNQFTAQGKVEVIKRKGGN